MPRATKRSRNLDLTALTLGPTAAAVKAKVSHAQWRRIVKAAHKKGFAVDSFLQSDLPDPLKLRTRTSLRREAGKNVATAYAPAEAELTDRERRIANLDSKRKADNEYYLNWLKTKSGELEASAKGAQALYDSRQGEIRTQLQGEIAAARNTAGQVSLAQGGVVSDPSQSTALANPGESIRATERLAAEQTLGNQQSLTNQGHLAFASAASFALMAAEDAKRSARTWESMQDLADDKHKLTFAKAADSQKEVARLLEGEVAKAGSNREYLAALDKLDITRDTLNLKGKTERSKSRDRKDVLAEKKRHNQALETATTEANALKGDTNKLRRDEFIAKYGRTPEEWRRMSPGQRNQWLKKYTPTDGTAKGNAPTDTQVRNGRKEFRRVVSLMQGEGYKAGEGANAVSDFTDPAGDFKIKDPLLVKAAYQTSVYGGVDPATRTAFHRAYGIWLRLSLTEKRKQR
jgi:hypothetical protein